MAFSKEKLIINREISWLAFNHRVLQEAQDIKVPLVERLRFLGIFSNNMDEFYRVRVATVKRLAELPKKEKKKTEEEVTPAELLVLMQETVLKLKEEFTETYNIILQELEKKNIYIVNEKNITKEQKTFAEQYFQSKVAPLLVPIMLRGLPEFPYLKDRYIYLAVKLWRRTGTKKKQFAIIEVPSDKLPRFLVLPEKDKKHCIMFLDDVIRLNLHSIFRIFNYEKLIAHTIKITRDAELDIDDDVSKSFYEKMKKSVRQRRRGEPVRFLYDSEMPPDMLEYLKEKLELDNDDNIISGGKYHNSKDFMKFPNVGTPDLEFSKTPALKHKYFMENKSMLDVIEEKDILLHFPYHEFDHIISLLREAAIHPEVKEIKITLYRLATQSKIINALVNAARNGKKVTVILEIKARFDEEANMDWAKVLQEEGVKVLFGIPELKVHCKLLVITRKQKGVLKNFAAVSTGNFNEDTAKIYSDFCLITANKEIADEAQKVINLIEKTFKLYRFNNLIIAPLQMRNKFYKFIDTEIKNAKAGNKAYMILKLNSLVDEDMIKRLYQASKAGVKIQMIVRGICSLIPGIKDLSENIKITSIIDKYLEHSRVFIFCNGGDEQIYISSADWMTRNLDFRIEVACPIFDDKIKREIKQVIDIQLSDNVKARILDKDLKNQYEKSKPKTQIVRAQKDTYFIYKTIA
jgi:polyphosphate kinase